MESLFILIVDDEPGVALLCSRLLTREGFSTESFTDPRAAVHFLTQHPIDMLLVDIRMPEIDGFEVIEHTQRLHPEAAILIMTGHGTVETAIKALRKGVDGLILKPFQQGNDLLAAVQQAFADNQLKRDANRIKALRPLFSVTESLLSETRRENLIRLIVDATCENLNCGLAGYYQRTAGDDRYRLFSSKGDLFKDDSHYQVVNLLIEDGGLENFILVNANGPSKPDVKVLLNAAGLSSVILAPIKRPELSGALLAARLIDQSPFSESDKELFQILSRQAAVALENSRLYEEQLEAYRKMEESQKALIQAEKMATAGRLIASIAHEVNNPLQAVQNCLHLASRTAMQAAKQKEYIEMAQTELERLMLTVQRMLDYYRPGGTSFDKVNVGEALQYVINLMSKQLAENSIQISLGLPADIPLVLAVRSQIQQVFINLLLNAADAMPGGGKIVITGRSLNGGAEIFFKDSGIGIPSNDQANIFEPFFSTKEGGSGLGLTVSSNIVTAHGGTLELLSGPDPGACFRLYLPAGGKP